MKTFTLALFIFSILAVRAWADADLAAAQRSLKEQGFYYGEATGEKNADTSAALRRFQIRNGLEVTGELNEETKRLLKTARATPSPGPGTSGPVEEEEAGEEEDTEPPRNDVGPSRGQVRPLPEQEEEDFAGPPPGRTLRGGAIFQDTPYDLAPPPLQQQVVADVQFQLMRKRLYRSGVDGVFGPDTEFALRAFQAETGLAVTGRIDMDTLAALQLLPNQRGNYRGPRRVYPARRPPVILRGEWIR